MSESENVTPPKPAPAPATPAPAPAAPAARTADELKRDPLVAASIARMPGAIRDVKEFAGEITVTVDRENIEEICRFFKEDSYTYLVDLTAVDYSKYPGHTGTRFGVVYTLYSFAKNARVRLRCFTGERTQVPSVTGVWKTANWYEREIFDMFGIEFEGHPNLERILLWEGFNGHPLRKDFPIRGIDTGARIYPEVFPPGGGPKEGSTGKDPKDVNLYEGPWNRYGTSPPAQLARARAEASRAAIAPGETPVQQTPAPEMAAVVAETAQPTTGAPWHNPDLALPQRMELAKGADFKGKLFAAMAQTDCTACGWDCEGYAEALAKGETKDITLCVPGEAETEDTLRELMTKAGRL